MAQERATKRIRYSEEYLEQLPKARGVTIPLIRVRLCRGWSLDRAIKTPARPKQERQRKPLYPNLANWMDEHHLTMLDASVDFDIGETTLPNVLYGFVNPSKNTIDKILEATGMTYEECFKEA